MINSDTQLLWHVTVLSNFARGYEKYSRVYSKSRIAESTFPDRFFLLNESELQIGISKASKLLAKLNVFQFGSIYQLRCTSFRSFSLQHSLHQRIFGPVDALHKLQ